MKYINVRYDLTPKQLLDLFSTTCSSKYYAMLFRIDHNNNVLMLWTAPSGTNLKDHNKERVYKHINLPIQKAFDILEASSIPTYIDERITTQE